jgi:glutamyl-tRNA synthetase
VELASLNARIVRAMPYVEARPRLAALGLDDERLWLALRDNLARFDDITGLARLVRGPVTGVIDEADRGFIALARELLPPEPWSEGTWAAWTDALKARTGRKGRALYLPLRLALTGEDHGPELRNLLPLVGRKACLARLS